MGVVYKMNKNEDIEVLRDMIDTYERCSEPGIGMIVDIGLEEKTVNSFINICNLIEDLEDQYEILKYKITDKIQERKFELQQEYLDFEGDTILETLEDLLK